jgi:hypothetical protein
MRDGGLRKIYRQYLPHVHWCSIESPMTQTGIPDTNYCCGGVEGWIENKLVKSGDRVTMQPGQPAWLERRARAGGKVFIGVRWINCEDTFCLLRPEAGRILMDTGLGCVGARYWLGDWPGGPAKWQWRKIAEILGFV